MESLESTRSKDTKQVYLAGLQKKIKNKYDEAQERFEKSKSFDSLNNFFDDPNVEKTHRVTLTTIPKIKLPEGDFIHESQLTKCASVGNISNVTRFSEEIDTCFTKDLLVAHSELPLTATDEESSYEFVSIPTDSFTTISNDKNIDVSSETTKLSFRNKIKLKFAKAKERRHSKKLMTLKKNETSEIDKVILSTSATEKPPPTPTKHRKKNKIGTVTVGLIEAIGYESDPDGKTAGKYPLYCKLKLGNEKYKSKATKEKSGKYSWMKLFILSLHDDYMLEISLWERDTLIGRSNIDTKNLEKDKSHEMKLALTTSPNVELIVLITVTGMSRTIDNMHNFNDLTEQWFKQFEDVGTLTVDVYGAKGLLGSDYFCVVELDNQRVQTQTEYKAIDPNWFRTYNFAVHDITSILEITVFDETRVEVFGKISIPLLNIVNGQKQWFMLKDNNQREPANGLNARICLEMTVNWNLFKASIRVIAPKEEKLIKQRLYFDRHVLARNLTRIKVVVTWVLNALVVLKTCFEWESNRDNVIALVLWLTFCWNFHGWMVPLLFVLPFLWYRKEYQYVYDSIFPETKDENIWTDLDDTNGPNRTPSTASTINEKEEKSLRQRFQSIQDMVLEIQKNIGVVASYGESVKNLYNFTVPYLSWLSILFISLISFVLFLVPAKYLFMGWGVHKFTRKILRPNRIPNNEVLDLLSRVPDDETLLNCKLLPLNPLITVTEDEFVENKTYVPSFNE